MPTLKFSTKKNKSKQSFACSSAVTSFFLCGISGCFAVQGIWRFLFFVSSCCEFKLAAQQSSPALL
jgi:hypothetical protein